MVGHSQGEIAAAASPGALSLEDGARVVALRSRALIAALAGQRRDGVGGRAGRRGPGADRRAGGERLSVAAVNGPAATVVSGEPDALDELVAGCERAGSAGPADAGGLRLALAPQVEQIRDELLAALAAITPRTGRGPVVSRR